MRLAIIALAGCDGCQYNLVDREFVEFLGEHGITVSYWPLAGIGEEIGDVDVALVEGSVISGRDLEILNRARSKARVLVALGSCAHLGGVQGALGMSKPLSSYVRVDYYVRGCPVRPSEVIDLLKKVSTGLRWRVGERRFGIVERGGQLVGDGFMKLDQLKCFVCGRCVELCSRVGAAVLNYVHRGIQTLVSTPYGEPFERSGCIYCGLCAAYCPAGAITYSVVVDRVLAEVRRGLVTEVYIEPEALASISEAEGLSPLRVVGGLRALGFKRVTVYDPLESVDLGGEGGVVARSPAESALLKRLAPGVGFLELKVDVPPGVVYVSQCLSWKRAVPRTITAREAQLALRRLSYDILDEEYPDYVILRRCELPRVSSLADLAKPQREKAGQPLLFELCPGGCLMGGGQPLSGGKSVGVVLNDRWMRLREVKELLGPRQRR